jgi:hypothetical protein
MPASEIKGEMMLRTLALLLAIFATLILSSVPTPPQVEAADPKKETGVMKFRVPVRVIGIILEGDYLFVHDDAMSARGEACTSIYELGGGNKPLITFHCVRVQRPKANSFIVRTELVSTEPLLYELKEIQFAGSTDAHQVPSHAHVTRATIDIFGE